MNRPALLILSWLLVAASASAEYWPGWRGPHGDGTSDDKNVPLEWSAPKNVRWKAAIPGIGHSSPVVYGDRVFVTSCVDKKPAGKDTDGDRVLLALDRASGKVLWEKTVITAKLEGKHSHN